MITYVFEVLYGYGTRAHLGRRKTNLHKHVVLGRNVLVLFVIIDDHISSGRTETKPQDRREQQRRAFGVPGKREQAQHFGHATHYVGHDCPASVRVQLVIRRVRYNIYIVHVFFAEYHSIFTIYTWSPSPLEMKLIRLKTFWRANTQKHLDWKVGSYYVEGPLVVFNNRVYTWNFDIE